MLNNKIYKIGIAGYGLVGKRRRQFIDKHDDMMTVAVCDQYFDKSGVVSDGVKHFKNYQQLLKERYALVKSSKES